MMNRGILILLFAIASISDTYGQVTELTIPVTEVFSENSIFKLKSVTYTTDNAMLSGKSYVFKNDELIYTIPRPFIFSYQLNTRLVLSNDGRTVVYLNNNNNITNSENKNLPAVMVYRDGLFVNSINKSKWSNCVENDPECQLLYEDFQNVLHFKKSKLGPVSYKKVYKNSIDDLELWLHENTVIVKDEMLYTINSNKSVSAFNMNTFLIEPEITFDLIYPFLKGFSAPVVSFNTIHDTYHSIDEFTEHGKTIPLSDLIGKMTRLIPIDMKEASQIPDLKVYQLQISGYLTEFGYFKIEQLEGDVIFDLEKLKVYLQDTRFETKKLDPKIKRHYFNNFFKVYRTPQAEELKVEQPTTAKN